MVATLVPWAGSSIELEELEGGDISWWVLSICSLKIVREVVVKARYVQCIKRTLGHIEKQYGSGNQRGR